MSASESSMPRDLTIIHLTDTHIAAENPFLNIDSAQKLRNAVATIQSMDVKPDLFVISGDLTHNGNEAAYEKFKGLVTEIEETFRVPVLLALGNHDFRVPFRKVMFGEDEPDENKPYYYQQQIGDLRIIVLDSKVAGSDVGKFEPDQLAWLANQLSTPSEARQTLLVFHHPAISNPIMKQDHLLTNAADLAAVLKGHDIVGILSGHIHFHSIGLFQGIPSFSGTGVAFTLDPSATQGLRMMDGSGFNLITLRDGQLTVNPYVLGEANKELYYYKPQHNGTAIEHQ